MLQTVTVLADCPAKYVIAKAKYPARFSPTIPNLMSSARLRAQFYNQVVYSKFSNIPRLHSARNDRGSELHCFSLGKASALGQLADIDSSL